MPTEPKEVELTAVEDDLSTKEPVEKLFEEQEKAEEASATEYKKVKSETHVLKAKRKYHPNDPKYQGCDSTQDSMMAEIRFFGSLTPEQSTLFSKDKLIATPEKTNEFWKTLQVNDVIGYKGNVYKLEEKSKTSLSLVKRKLSKYRNEEPVYLTTSEKVSKYEIDYALNIDFCEILYRDGKPFGVSDEVEYKVKVDLFENKDGNVLVQQNGKKI